MFVLQGARLVDCLCSGYVYWIMDMEKHMAATQAYYDDKLGVTAPKVSAQLWPKFACDLLTHPERGWIDALRAQFDHLNGLRRGKPMAPMEV